MNFKLKNGTMPVLDFLPNRMFEIDINVKINDDIRGELFVDEYGNRSVLIDKSVQIEVLTRDYQYLQFKPWIKIEDAINEARNLGFRGLILAGGSFYVIHEKLFNTKANMIERKRLYDYVNNDGEKNSTGSRNGLGRTIDDVVFQSTIDRIQKSQNSSANSKLRKSTGIAQIQRFNNSNTDISNIVKFR